MSAPAHATANGEQFYVTHCTTADSVTNSPGYSVRATSAVDDPNLFRRALEYPPYELPLEMWREKPTQAQTPRRLARTHLASGGVWVVHTVYLEKDTMGRDRSYFTHLLHFTAPTDPATVLESWDAGDWVKGYAAGAAKSLQRGPLPHGTAISRNALTAFLSDSAATTGDLASCVCPPRLQADPTARRSLVGRFLKAVVLATDARESGQSRGRVYVHAEPGLTAMLLYAAARLLPASYVDDLTFSTFEPSHRGMRDYKLAMVVGTYVGAPGKGLDPDLATVRGFGLDTIVPERSSAELTEAAALPPGLADLVELGAAGEWELLDAVHRFIGQETGSFAKVASTVPLARAVTRLTRGGLATADLLALKADGRGAAILAQHADKVWAFVKDEALRNAALRTAFRDWLAEPARLADYRHDACEALRRGDLDGWETRWAVVREVCSAEQLKQQTDKAQQELDDAFPTFPPAARNRFRSACAIAGLRPDHHLLAPTGPEELNALLTPTTPADWQGYVCFAVMGKDENNWLLDATKPARPAMRDRVRKHLIAAPAPVLAAYLSHARDFLAREPQLLYDLLQPFRPECRAFLGRAIDAGASTIEAGDWVRLLGDLDIYGQNNKNWEGFLFQNDYLAKLLAGFKADEAAAPIWESYLDLLSLDLLEGDAWETRLYNQLDQARRALGSAGVPFKAAAKTGIRKLNATDTLLAIWADPESAEATDTSSLLEAFQAFQVDPLEALRRLYLFKRFDQFDLNRDPETLKPFITVFRACYPISHEYFSARTAVTQWLALSESCPIATRAAFQEYFVRNHIPEGWHTIILEERTQVRFQPEAEARIREGLASTARKAGEQYRPPAGTRRSSSGSSNSGSEEDLSFASEATKRAKKSRGGRTYRKGRGGRQSGGIPAWVWLVVGSVIIAILVAVAYTQLRKKKIAVRAVEELRTLTIAAG